MAEARKFHVYFEDEAPRLGSGWRIVLAAIGHKWVRLRVPNAERGTRIKRPVWDKLRKDQRYVHQKERLAHHQR